MVRSNRWILVVGAAIAGLGAQGCATESSAFRHMSAETHEQAANVPSSDVGASASDHLAAARRLRDMEQAACVDVPEADRDQGPFARRDRIMGLQPLSERPYPKQMLQPAGVAVYLRATPGLTEQWLGRVLECHMAHHAVVGDRIASRSPLFVDDVRVAMSSTGDGFRIAITTRDPAAAREVIERARTLAE